MDSRTISTKVPREISRRIAETGHPVSNVVQVSLKMFLNLPAKQKEILVKGHINDKKLEKAQERFPEWETN